MTTGQKFQAIKDVNMKYVFSLGGGINGRTVKAGEVVTFLGESTEIDTPCVSCFELLHRITKDSFNKLFLPVSS